MLGTQNVLGTPREPFSHLLNEMLFVYEIFIVQTWLKGWEKNIQFIIFFVWTDEPVAYVPSIKGKDQNAVVRLKDFQKLVDSILNTIPKVLRYPREKTQPYETTSPPCEKSFNLLVRG